MGRSLLWFVFFLCNVYVAKATHNRGGEITYRHVSGNTYEITVVTYTKLTNAADRPELLVKWGDNTQDSVPRTNQTPLGNDIGRNIYIAQHTYPGPASYTISVEDPNRNGGVINIPNSISIPFYIQTVLVINPFLGVNNSPTLLYPPIDRGCTNRLFMHNPGAFDRDGDSLSYSLTTCRGDQGLPIPGYTFPNASFFFSLDPVTGDLTWDKPVQQGEYNIAILIREWRNGILIGEITRDMQVDIDACSNNPPVFETLRDTCIEVGQPLQIVVRATDVDLNRITLTASSGMFNLPTNPAVFQQPVNGNAAVASVFRWTPDCSQVRNQPYSVVFRAVDNGLPNLVALQSWRIRVVAPAPKNITATSRGGAITLNWDAHPCNNASGYKIYRKQGPSGWNPDTCETGVPAYTGFTLIDTVVGRNSTTLVDDDNGNGLASGVEYCYRVTAFFDGPGTFVTSQAESYASAEVCQVVLRDLPVLAQADVSTTSKTNGAVQVKWALPTQLDTTQFPGPYKYELTRADNPAMNGALSIYQATGPWLAALTDTAFLDTNLNTQDKAWYYKINLLWDSNKPVGKTRPASTHFLKLTPQSARIRLDWSYAVNWTVDSFIVYRENLGAFIPIDTVVGANTYTDRELTNGVIYCYKVLSVGGFRTGNLPSISLNRTQISCDFPKDTVPPCPMTFTLDSNCVALENTLNWTLPLQDCFDDLLKFRIYYSPKLGDPFIQIDSVGKDARTYTFRSTRSSAGCFSLVAVDSSYNESSRDIFFCVDNCPEYTLPNVFTPNEDGKNDRFKPFPYRAVEKVEMKILNRWGQEVFNTQNPDILWDGISSQTGQPCSEGAYFYQCTVYYTRLGGVETQFLRGIVNLLR